MEASATQAEAPKPKLDNLPIAKLMNDAQNIIFYKFKVFLIDLKQSLPR